MKMLFVQWSKTCSANYYIDKYKDSLAKDRKSKIILSSYSGTYSFDKETKAVTLDTGAEIKSVSVIDWKEYETPDN